MSSNSKKNRVSISRISITFALVITLILPNFFLPDVAKAATFKDIKKHWAESYIEKAVTKGLVKGFSDGTFKPDSPVTRAEFAAMVNRLLKNNSTSYTHFSDVNRVDWFYDDVSKAVAAGYVGGYKDGTFKPGEATSRQEAAVMLSRFLPVAGLSTNISAFVDAGSIENWSREAVGKISKRGYLKGYPDGAFHPTDKLTRAMVAKILCEISDNENIISANTSVYSSGTSLSNRIYSNNVEIQESLREGNATLSNVVVLGTLSVYGGGSKSIRIDDSRIANAKIKKSSSPVRILLSSHSVIVNADISEKAILETQSLSGGIFGKGFQNINVERNSNVALRGDFDIVNLNGSNTELTIEKGVLKTLETSYSAGGSTIKVEDRAKIEKANTNAKVAFTGEGTIDELNAMVSGITYAKKPNRIYTSKGASMPTEDTSSNFEIKVSPKDKEKNVGKNQDVILTFKESLVNLKNKDITSSDIKDAIEIRKDKKSGKSIDYTVDISKRRTVITLDPKDSFESDTTYYVIIRDKMLKYEDGDKISEQITYFYTGKDNKVGDAVFYPKDGATNVSRKINPTIKFDEAIELKDGSSFSNSRLKKYIELRKNNSRGTQIDFSAYIDNKNKEITIVPDPRLEDGQKYYLYINGAGFRFSNNSGTVQGGSVTWTVGENITMPKVTIIPANGSTGVSENPDIVVTFDKKVYKDSNLKSLDTAYAGTHIKLKEKTGREITCTVIISSNSTKITLTPTYPLNPSVEYEVIVDSSFYDEDKNTNRRTTSKFTVKGVTINTSALDNAIKAAKDARDATVEADSADQVDENKYFVTRAVMLALNTAISEAEKPEHRTSENNALKAANALQAALLTFEQARVKGTRPDISALTSQIKAAEGLLQTQKSEKGLDVANGSDWVNDTDIQSLSDAIDAAKLYSANPTKEKFAEEINNLTKAIDTFNKAKKPGKRELFVSIGIAEEKIKDVKTAENGDNVLTTEWWATETDKNALQGEIDKAKAEKVSYISTHSSVQTATESLNAAIKAFTPQKGTKTE